MIDSLPPFSERAALRGGLFRIRKACFNGNKLATNRPINRIKQALDGYIQYKSDVNPRMPLKQWENRLFSRFRGFFNVWKLVGICAFFEKLWQQFTTIYLFDLFS